ncbi:MAG: serpin family protein [Candidatus Omnitrophota bacterium]
MNSIYLNWRRITILMSFLIVLVFSNTFAQEIAPVVEANNKFAFELYSKYKSKDGNVFFSPYSISSALAMTYEGARGKTAEEMLAVFHFPKEATLCREGFLSINNQINKEDKRYELKVANALWAQKDSRFLEAYFKLIESYYGGGVTNLDFINDTENSRLTINNWVEEKTNKKIKNLIPQGIITTMTRLVLTNAIYFRGKWLMQFDEKNTVEGDFKVTPENSVRVKMMKKTDKEAEFNYGETDKLQILELPYDGQELSMLLLLPKNGDLKSVEQSLDSQTLTALKNKLQMQWVNVFLPKFKFETKYFMADDLKEMGMPTAFSDMADFSGMTGNKDLFISQVIHQAFVEVNEEGTEAAAATAVIVEKCSVLPSRPKIFKADHPFIFIIQETKTGNILFIGRVSDPIKDESKS